MGGGKGIEDRGFSMRSPCMSRGAAAPLLLLAIGYVQLYNIVKNFGNDAVLAGDDKQDIGIL